MDKEKADTARRVMVNLVTMEHRRRVHLRVKAQGDLAAEQARQEVWKAHRAQEDFAGGGPGSGYNEEIRRMEYLEKDAKLAIENEELTAAAMEYLTLHFVDQLSAAKA